MKLLFSIRNQNLVQLNHLLDMRALARVLTTLKINSFPHRLYCNSINQSSSNSFIERLINEPKSRTKEILESEANFILNGFDFSWHALVAKLKCSSLQKAQLALEWRLQKMQETDEKDVESYSEVIALCGEIHNVQLAIHAFRAMEANGMKPTSDVFNSLIKACSSPSDECTALSLFEIMEKSDAYKPNSRTYNALISIYAINGNLKSMQAWHSRKKAAGFAPDLHCYEALISGCIKLNSYEAADRYYEEMVSSGIIPNVFIREKMLDGLCKQGNICRIREYLKSMLEDGAVVSIDMAQRLLRFYSKFGSIEDMEELFQTLVASNSCSEVLQRVHNELIKMHAQVAD
ncbi:hypothetical protein Droror1_Dr00024445 [Drosera rotundifolia]